MAAPIQSLNNCEVRSIIRYWTILDILDHPPYSPELAPDDFYLFLHLKEHIAGKKFDDDDEV